MKIKQIPPIVWLIGFPIAALGLFSMSMSVRFSDCSIGDMVLNAGTELLGIAITVCFVQCLFDLMQRRVDIESLAWDILFDTDYTIWVWQGGERVFNPEELIYLINKISQTDPLPATTGNLILALGNKASNILKTKKELIKDNKKLVQGLEELSQLSRIRDKGVIKSNREIAGVFQNTVKILVNVLEIKLREDAEKEYERNCDEKEQIWRHTGQKLEPTSGEGVNIKRHLELGRGVN